MTIRLLNENEHHQGVISVLNQLRPQLSATALGAQISRQQQHGYCVAFAESESQVECVAGFWLAEKLAWGKHIYVDDLVTAENIRGTGVGSRVIAWIEQYGRDRQCDQLHLDSGVQRFGAHKFYVQHGFVISSHHFAKDLNSQ